LDALGLILALQTKEEEEEEEERRRRRSICSNKYINYLNSAIPQCVHVSKHQVTFNITWNFLSFILSFS
jgi:hypothetical protein